MKKTIVFLFGLISYVVFLISFLYAIGFVGNLLVPKSIDTGIQESLTSAILINLVLLSLFAIQHSIMARPAFKAKWTKIVDPASERSIFVLLTSLILLLIFWKWQPMTGIVWETDHSVVVIILQVLFWLGWLIVLLSTFMINHFHLFGLSQIWSNLKNNEPPKLKFVEKYFYKFVRHPIMTGFIIAFWATPVMTTGHLLFAAVTTVYILISVKYLEEPDLKNAIGQDYEDYQKRVPMLFPGLK